LKIESDKIKIPHPVESVHEWLSDLNNYEVLFPADRISDWESDKESLKFRIQGTATISMVTKASDSANITYLNSGEDSPFPFTLEIVLASQEASCEVQIIFLGEVNAMLSMMIERPLTNLFNHMAERMAEITI